MAACSVGYAQTPKRSIVVRTIDGREVTIVAHQVTSLHAAKEHESNKLLPDEVQCTVGLADGKFVNTAETCSNIRQMLEDAK
jgi:N-acetylglutamate synthase/N-acetylornithine aminotransferase